MSQKIIIFLLLIHHNFIALNVTQLLALVYVGFLAPPFVDTPSKQLDDGSVNLHIASLSCWLNASTQFSLGKIINKSDEFQLETTVIYLDPRRLYKTQKPVMELFTSPPPQHCKKLCNYVIEASSKIDTLGYEIRKISPSNMSYITNFLGLMTGHN